MWDGSEEEEERPTLVPVPTKEGGSMRPTDGYVTPVSPKKKKKTPTKTSVSAPALKPLINGTSFGFRVGLLRTPEHTWNRICINTSGEECVNNATKEFCSRNVGRTWLTSGLCGRELERGGRIE